MLARRSPVASVCFGQTLRCQPPLKSSRLAASPEVNEPGQRCASTLLPASSDYKISPRACAWSKSITATSTPRPLLTPPKSSASTTTPHYHRHLYPYTSISSSSTSFFSTYPAKMRLTSENINQRVVAAKYAVRGELAVKSEEYRAKIAKGDTGDLPFKQVISANIGNPQQLDQKPITFFRQVASLLENLLLLQNEEALAKHFGYQTDVIERAKFLLSKIGSVGAYSASTGVPAIRDSIAQFIERRDGFPADPDHIYLSAGASSGVNTLLNVICASPKTGILIPIPQYPLYTATLSLLTPPLFLTSLTSIRTGVPTSTPSVPHTKRPRLTALTFDALLLSTPVTLPVPLPEEDIRAVLEFANKENLVVMADEVYQTNVFVGKFHSFKAVLRTLEKENPGKFDGLELASSQCLQGHGW
ncbi:alanine transaminase [Fusarium oxysporum]|nr:alanine transaminase [Fusarium oxysporum]